MCCFWGLSCVLILGIILCVDSGDYHVCWFWGLTYMLILVMGMSTWN